MRVDHPPGEGPISALAKEAGSANIGSAETTSNQLPAGRSTSPESILPRISPDDVPAEAELEVRVAHPPGGRPDHALAKDACCAEIGSAEIASNQVAAGRSADSESVVPCISPDDVPAEVELAVGVDRSPEGRPRSHRWQRKLAAPTSDLPRSR